MSSSFEKSVKGGTKVKLAPPKTKYVEHILLATQSGEAGVAEVFRTLVHRLRDATWTVVFKSLIIVHLMIKEGALDVTLRYLSAAPKKSLAINNFTNVQTQGANIRHYSEYLLARAQAFASTKCDHVRSGDTHVKRLSVDKGLLRETEAIQEQIRALLKCDLLSTESENEISLTAFRLLTRDLLDLYNVENAAVMSVLSHYFEMSRPDAERAIKIYKTFCKQTDHVVQYLSVARQYEHATRLAIPKIKHAPTSLAQSLQEYLDDKDFDINRRQYLAEQEARKSGKPIANTSKTTFQKPSWQASAQPTSATSQPNPPSSSNNNPINRGPAPDLIDFFESIETQQQPMAQPNVVYTQMQTNPYNQPQPTGFMPGQQQQPPQIGLNPYQSAVLPANMAQFPGPIDTASAFGSAQQTQTFASPINGPGYSGYPTQPQQQVGYPSQDLGQQQPQVPSQMPTSSISPIQAQPTSSNPFRQSMMATGGFGPPQRQGTNPFARGMAPVNENEPQSFAPEPPPMLNAQLTGTNPFARSVQPQQQPIMNTLQVQPTGSTNPFRQSQFINQQTGQGWQNGQQGTMGGLEGLDTIPVFPRPGQMPAQTTQQSPWG